MSNYKTKDQEIISRASKGLVSPSKVVIPKFDSSTKSLLVTNPHNHPLDPSRYSGRLPDVNFKSYQERDKMLKDAKKKTSSLSKEQLDALTLPVNVNNPDSY